MVKLMKKNTDDGAKIYTPLTLKLYTEPQFLAMELCTIASVKN